MNTCQDSLAYWVDASNTILKVEGPWDRFAVENDGARACASMVLGKPLEQFIAGDVSRMFVNTMLMSARSLQRNLTRPYRCDSVSLKRHMEMTIQPWENGVLEVRHRTLRTETLAVSNPVALPSTERHRHLRLKRCSMCNRIQLHDIWEELDAAMAHGLMPKHWVNGNWVFGICPACRSTLALVT